MFVLIVGGGKTGSRLAQLLLAGKHEVKVIDWRKDVADRLETELGANYVLFGDGDDPQVLMTAGIRRADVLVAVTGDDEDNLVACTLGRLEFNVPRIIARINNPKNAWLFTPDMGVDVAIDQSDMVAHLVTEEMSLGYMMTLLKLRAGEYALVEEQVAPGATADGKAICDLLLPKLCVLTAVIRQGQVIMPHGDVILQPGDEVIGLVHESQMAELAAILSKPGA
jgi:trk system potassium uptake protein TrkA